MKTFQRWDALTREQLAEAAPRAVTVLPVAAIEQHGPHLPTSTDTALVTAVAERACAEAAAEVDVLLAPTLCYGASDHHLQFGATLSLSTDTLGRILADLLRSAAAAGAARVLLLNGHGGNAATCAVSAANASRDHQISVAAASYWDLLDPPKEFPNFPGHAGMFETALMLAVDPEHVRLDRAAASPASPPPAHRGLALNPRGLWKAIDGFTDDPRTATAELGHHYLGACTAAVADAIRVVARLAA